MSLALKPKPTLPPLAASAEAASARAVAARAKSTQRRLPIVVWPMTFISSPLRRVPWGRRATGISRPGSRSARAAASRGVGELFREKRAARRGAASTSQGHPRIILRRALEHDNLVLAEVTAREIGRLTIKALDLTALVARKQPERYGRFAARREEVAGGTGGVQVPPASRPTLALRRLAGAEGEGEVGTAGRGVRDAGHPADGTTARTEDVEVVRAGHHELPGGGVEAAAEPVRSGQAVDGARRPVAERDAVRR